MSLNKLSKVDGRPTWQQQLAQAFTNTASLLAYLELSDHELPCSKAAEVSFALRVPLSFASRMEKGNPLDPLLRQILPLQHETRSYPGFSNDPVGDLEAVSEIGVLQKYHARVLLINTAACAINCRYCFRRNFPYQENFLSRQRELAAIQFINNRPDISEVILSGGDPLLINDQHLQELFTKLSAIEHIQRIRIHTRIPIVLPDRITKNLLNILTKTNKQVIIVLHSNHGNEIEMSVASACKAFRQCGITLLNQAVLLKDINDNADSLCNLSEKLFAAGILPYYLHLLDKAKGTGHFDVPESRAVAIMREVQIKLPGYLVPKLVREQAGTLNKQLVVN